MKTIILTLLIAITINSVTAQNFNKEADHLRLLSTSKENHIYVDFLDKFSYKQEIGLGAPEDYYIEYKSTKKLDKNENIILKGHPYFSSVSYNAVNGIIRSIRLNIIPNKVALVEEQLTSLFGYPDKMTSWHLEQSLYFVPNKYWIVFKSKALISSPPDRYIDISALDFANNKLSYNEFTKVGMVKYDNTPMEHIGDDVLNILYFTYVFNKKENSRMYLISNFYSGDNWFFGDKIDFLLDNDEVVSLEAKPDRHTSKSDAGITCIENLLIMVSPEFITKILDAKSVKIRINGKSQDITFELTPLHRYQILTAKYYYENNIIPSVD